MKLHKRKKYWIFDMDGTLTIAQHDFLAIKNELGIPIDNDILTSLSQLPPNIREQKKIELDDIELKIAKLAKASQGCEILLKEIKVNPNRLGILTRNSFKNSLETLKAAGISDFFSQNDIVCRERAIPKPNPDGIFYLMKQWNAIPEETVMIGDYLFDLEAGKQANVDTIYIDPSGSFPFRQQSNYQITKLEEILLL
ncbi:HAD family hydrolase [Leptospira biflexa]|jgi:HAD superfamily hydrolase (TIGR01549 family)|uniref:Putative hydrolase, HAD superfamily, subfamily IA, variant 1 n=1 Tax=Leptospira biflexa serovar Patoc (strain Patoc 1 / ATCC 23582 / Paris) TaxID=456481 RepID=B0SN88_LEPBP|nr:HAD-IA family hydrolase [Leptospira biflexa]ABZ95175.1 Phosphatase [Leptospira biflexa serovar Patoc strain 'Patoc 1 (Ames)']ABZ98855.1 Putative hydrolase, HAD superfamily, subfamily IA, variant 1 [Leptospira biflexa serovar Patoc strain 'Patoc 1 (Paris)']TGM34826.1 HAD family hydrolase [Leptospira biflexa]TGM42281.1 HAD family hydrolase [Leptospira biflexa]TGM42381.1 HAD family hydrolase [Leptospira biflexa]